MNKFIIVFCLGNLFFSCSKSGNTSTGATVFFPPVLVNVTLLKTDPYYTFLTFAPGGWSYISNVGNKGIIIYHTMNDTYVAFDRTCPVNPTDTCAYVSMDSSGIYYSCSKSHIFGPPCTGTSAGICNSTFLPDIGFPRSGTAKIPLKQYVVKTDDDRIYITN